MCGNGFPVHNRYFGLLRRQVGVTLGEDVSGVGGRAGLRLA